MVLDARAGRLAGWVAEMVTRQAAAGGEMAGPIDDLHMQLEFIRRH